MHQPITRRAAAQMLAAAPAILSAQNRRPPNILLFFPDQWRPDWTSFTTGLAVRTPHLESLARRGVVFSNAVVPSPLCAPSRACLASGREYDRCGVPGNRYDFPLSTPTFYQHLRDAGYHVMGCGKLDLHKKTLDWGLDGSRLTKDWGFSDAIDNAGKRDAIASGKNEPKDPYMAYLYQEKLARTHIDDFLRRTEYADTFPTELPDRAYCDNWIGENGMKLLGRAPAGKPWFLAINFTGPHSPMDITHTMQKTMGDRRYPMPYGNEEFDEPTHNSIRQNYTAMVENLDSWLGRFVLELRRRGELDNTLIIVSSDHGEMLGDHGRWAKSLPWQASMGVPLVVAGPGVAAGRELAAPVSLVDLPATFLDYAGAKPLPDADSRSMRRLFDGSATRLRPAVLSGLGDWRAVYDGEYKLMVNFDPAARRNNNAQSGSSAPVPDLLFRVKGDPLESNNLAAARPEHVRRLKRFLMAG